MLVCRSQLQFSISKSRAARMSYRPAKRHAEQRPCSIVHAQGNMGRNVRWLRLLLWPSRGGFPGAQRRAELQQPVLRAEPSNIMPCRALGRTQGSVQPAHWQAVILHVAREVSKQDTDLARMPSQQLWAQKGKTGSSGFGALSWNNGFQLWVLEEEEKKKSRGGWVTRTSKDKARKENSRTCSVTSSTLKIEAIDPNHRQASARLQQLSYGAEATEEGSITPAKPTNRDQSFHRRQKSDVCCKQQSCEPHTQTVGLTVQRDCSDL